MEKPIEEHKDFNPPIKDKRKAAYKKYKADFKAKMNEEGLGDKIEKITKATGIKKIVDTIFGATGVDCKCDKRKHDLNNANKAEGQRPSWEIKNCPTEKEYNFLHEYFSAQQTTGISGPQQDQFNSILENVFDRKFERVGCCYGDRLNEAKKIYLAYK